MPRAESDLMAFHFRSADNDIVHRGASNELCLSQSKEILRRVRGKLGVALWFST